MQMTASGLVASVYEFAGDQWNSSVARAGGCHIRIAMVDPAAVVQEVLLKTDDGGETTVAVAAPAAAIPIQCTMGTTLRAGAH